MYDKLLNNFITILPFFAILNFLSYKWFSVMEREEKYRIKWYYFLLSAIITTSIIACHQTYK